MSTVQTAERPVQGMPDRAGRYPEGTPQVSLYDLIRLAQNEAVSADAPIRIVNEYGPVTEFNSWELWVADGQINISVRPYLDPEERVELTPQGAQFLNTSSHRAEVHRVY